MSYTQAAELLSDLRPFIRYLETTRENEWQVDVVRNKGNTKNCLFGHLVNWAYGKHHQDDVTAVWDAFEAMWSTTYQIYPINDGENPRYQQITPKQRVLAYLNNLWLGIEVDTQTGMRQEYEASIA